MLEKWLGRDVTASWTKLFSIIESLEVRHASGEMTSALDQSRDKSMSGPLRVSDLDDGGLEQFKEPDKVNTRPLVRDLYKHVTPRYAADWEVIGTLLGIPRGQLDAIEADYPNKDKDCCQRMLQKWLEMDRAASWEKFFTDIESPAVCCTSNKVTLPLAQSSDKGISGSLRSTDVDDGGLEQFKNPDKVNTKPLLRDLYKHITPRYATEWKVIGTLLGQPSAELMFIGANFANASRDCCKMVLKKWLEKDSTASWGKLFLL